jgi:hypothetical protein
MKIVIEDVPEGLARELIRLATSSGLGTSSEPQWTPARAASLLRDLPDGTRQIIRMTVKGNGWADASSFRNAADISLLRQVGSISRAIKRGVRAGRLPEGLPVPLIAQYDSGKPSYQRTTGFTMPEDMLFAFRDAISLL